MEWFELCPGEISLTYLQLGELFYFQCSGIFFANKTLILKASSLQLLRDLMLCPTYASGLTSASTLD